MSVKHLSLITVALFAASLTTFYYENKRGTDLLSGSDYIKGLDVEKIQKIVVNFKNDKKIIFNKDANKFLIENHKNYPASTEKINDLIYKMASIQVKEKIESNASDSDLKKYELGPKSYHYLVELYDRKGDKKLAFRVGKTYRNRGNFLYKEDHSEIYLSNSPVWISDSHKNYITKSFLKIKTDTIQKITLKSNILMEFEKKEQNFVAVRPKKNKFKADKISEYAKVVGEINLSDYHAPTESDVRSLKYKHELSIQLDTKLLYKVSLANKNKKYFAKVHASASEIPSNIVLDSNDNKEKLEDIGNLFDAKTQVQNFNQIAARWVYQISKDDYEKIAKKSSYFRK